MKNKVILIIDDEKDLTELMALFLEEFGCQVIAAHDGEEGVAMSQEHNPDLIFLDYVMPKCKGDVVLQKLQEDSSTRKIPVVIMSGLGERVYFGEGRVKVNGQTDEHDHSKGWAMSTDAKWCWTPEDIMEEYSVAACLPKPFDKETLFEVFREVSARISKESDS